MLVPVAFVPGGRPCSNYGSSSLVGRASIIGSNDKEVSIGDLVGGLHGGKYQFGIGGAAHVGCDFAIALASSDMLDTVNNDTETPRWACKLEPEPERLAGELSFRADGDKAAVVHVTNTMNTWEPFFAQLFPDVGLEVFPHKGTLAPRGGANNVCDPSKPYSDSQHLEIRWDGRASSNAFLVVKTEEEQWTFLITAEAAP